MNETTETTPVEPSPQTERDWKKIGIAIVAIAILLLILWLAFAVRSANIRGARSAALNSATAFAAALEPLLDMRSRQEMVDDATLQRVCENLVATDRFRMVAITDQGGIVIASSDTAYRGQEFPGIDVQADSVVQADGTWQASVPITRAGIHFGAVVVRTTID